MQWLIELQTNADPISACRLMNIFRRKGLEIVTLAMSAQAGGYSLLAVLAFPESELGHIFNYLRRTEGVKQLTCYRHDSSAEASFILSQAESDMSSAAHVLKSFPESRLIFASQGKYLLEVPPGSWPPSTDGGMGEMGFLPFVRVLATEGVSRQELVDAVLEP